MYIYINKYIKHVKCIYTINWIIERFHCKVISWVFNNIAWHLLSEIFIKRTDRCSSESYLSISKHLSRDSQTYEEKICHTLMHPFLQRIHNWPLKKKSKEKQENYFIVLLHSTSLNFWFWYLFKDWSNFYYWAAKVQKMRKFTHIVYDLWTKFSQMKISPIHCSQQTDSFESHVHTVGNLSPGLCYHGGNLRITTLKDQDTERPTRSCKAFTQNSTADT